MNGRGPYQNRVGGQEPSFSDIRQNMNGPRTGGNTDGISLSRPGASRASRSRGCNSSGPSTEGIDSTWSFGRIVLAIVPATTRYMAAALGAAAFLLQDSFVDEPPVFDSDVKPVYDFEAPPASTLSEDWGGELPAAIRRDTEIGHQLLETALTKTEQTSEPTPYLYDEEGDPLTGRDALEAVTQTDVDEEKSYWVVPGVVQRYTVTVPDGPKTQLSCECRSFMTPHVFTGRGGAPLSVPDIARPIWVCSTCGRPTYGPEPVDVANRDATSETIPGPDGERIKVSLPGGSAREHKRQITAYHNENKQYPWEDDNR